MKNKNVVVGIGEDTITAEKRVVTSGDTIFKFVDQIGLPLDICVMELRDRNLSFDVHGFVIAAHKAGWPSKRVENMIMGSGKLPQEVIGHLNTSLSLIYKSE